MALNASDFTSGGQPQAYTFIMPVHEEVELTIIHGLLFFQQAGFGSETHRPFWGPTFGTYEDVAVMEESGISPDSIPSGRSHVPGNKGRR